MDKLVITRLQGKICTTSVSDRKVTGITLEDKLDHLLEEGRRHLSLIIFTLERSRR